MTNHVVWGRSGGKTFLEERLAPREANEKMVLEPLAYSLDIP
jgi:hypothetical protein